MLTELQQQGRGCTELGVCACQIMLGGEEASEQSSSMKPGQAELAELLAPAFAKFPCVAGLRGFATRAVLSLTEFLQPKRRLYRRQGRARHRGAGCRSPNWISHWLRPRAGVLSGEIAARWPRASQRSLVQGARREPLRTELGRTLPDCEQCVGGAPNAQLRPG